MIIKVQNEDKEKRLDIFLTKKLSLSRTQIQRLIRSGEITVNSKKRNAHYPICENDEIEITISTPKKSEHEAENIPLDIIYEDKNVIVVNKQAGIAVHPSESGGNESGTLVNALLHHCKNLSGIGGVMRPGIVHRLDKDTSGVLIIAKNDKTHQFLSKQIKEREVDKTYIALVRGKLTPTEGKIDSPISRSTKNKKKMAISSSKSAKHAVTEYKVTKYFEYPEECTLVEVKLLTGRTHQIRVHFSAIGYPLIGDPTYGNEKTNKNFIQYDLHRQFLHSQKLSIKIPGKTKKQTFEASLPKDLLNFLNHKESRAQEYSPAI